jgi:hypothetical protein
LTFVGTFELQNGIIPESQKISFALIDPFRQTERNGTFFFFLLINSAAPENENEPL